MKALHIDPITRNYQVLTPAYGKDYHSKHAVINAFLDGRDFVLNTPFGQTYCSIADFATGTVVNLRYHNKTKVTSVTVQ